ncbi:MAG: TIGR02757 family protein [Chitinophagales bacterium]|nr:MAG: TIGR02757 family protein [Chitinophagales bacterium]
MRIKRLLDKKFRQYNSKQFVAADPISIPHRFTLRQDIEIAGFFAATMAWGQRKTIISKCMNLMALMDYAPYDFILRHEEKDLERFLTFRHRTFQPDDVLYFIAFFKHFYSQENSLETAFSRFISPDDETLEKALIGFHDLFFSLEYVPQRTLKHVASPIKNSTCKRLNMFLRWMVRKDHSGVDFGLWNSIRPAQLLCPLDVHVGRVARKLGLLHPKSTGWKAVKELTGNLKKLDPSDPVKYDFALFGMGVMEKF